MEFKSINTRNWLTRKVSKKGLFSAVFSSLSLIIGAALFWFADPHLSQSMPVSSFDVFEKKEYWILWSSLFAHADSSHLFSNLFLFFPFSFYLAGYFGFLFFPLAGFFIGGLTNLIYRRDFKTRRMIKGIGIALILFFSTAYNHQVSYSAHLIGFMFGILSGVVLYFIFQKRFLKAEVIEYIPVEDVDFDWRNEQL